jgi:hypothetical protein
VALSLGSPPPVVNRHRIPVEPGLSSTNGSPRQQRPSSCLARGDVRRPTQTVKQQPREGEELGTTRSRAASQSFLSIARMCVLDSSEYNRRIGHTSRIQPVIATPYASDLIRSIQPGNSGRSGNGVAASL